MYIAGHLVVAPVIHVAFGGIIAKDAVNQDLLFMFAKPPILAAEPMFGLTGTWWHQAERKDADKESDGALNKEPELVSARWEPIMKNVQILPSTPAMKPAHLQNASG